MTVVSRAALLRALETVKPGLAKRDKIEQDTSFVFKKGLVLTFNGDVAVRCPTGLGDDALGACPPGPILAALEKLPDEEVEVGQVKSVLTVSGKGRSVDVRVDRNIRLPLDAVTAPGKWVRVPPEFAEALALAAEVTSKTDTRPQLVSVCIRDGVVEATDMYRIVRYTVKTGVTSAALVRREALLRLPDFEATRVAESEGWVHFRNPAGAVMSCFKQDVFYPADLEKHFRFSGVALALPRGLSTDAELAEALVGPDAEGGQVSLTIHKGKLRLLGEGPLARLRGVLPIRYDGPRASFRIGPKTLAALGQIASRGSGCEVAGDKLKIDGGRWKFFSRLTENSPNGRKGGDNDVRVQDADS
jgi:hypothetical protein